MPDVSVIIPTWNRAGFLEKAIRSALAQTLSPLEVLVCDDGSTDGSKQVVSDIKDQRVRWISGARGGRPAIPRNRGLRESRGEWLAFLDDDDEWLPHKLEKQLHLLEKLNCRAACSNAFRFSGSRNIMKDYLSFNPERITFDDLLQVNQVICSSSVFHRSLLLHIAGFPEADELIACEDYALWLRIATFTDFVFIPESLLVYRDDAAISLRSNSSNVWAQRQEVFADFERWGQGHLSVANRIKIKKQRIVDCYLKNKERLSDAFLR